MSELPGAAGRGHGSSRRALPGAAALGLVAALGAFSGCAKYARVEGTVIPPKAVAAQGEHVASTVVWVESKQQPASGSPGTKVMRCTETGFEPAWLPVSVGTRIRFRNDSGVFHTPFSPDPKSGFRLDPLRPGEAAEWMLSQPGEVRLFCELHSEATAVIMVLPAGEYADVDEAGRFRFPSLPSGPYVVSYWHPQWGTGQRRFEVPERGLVQVELKF